MSWREDFRKSGIRRSELASSSRRVVWRWRGAQCRQWWTMPLAMDFTTFGTRPLRRMAAVAARVDAGDLHPRIHDPGGQGHEVRVLADAFNHMLDRLTDAFAGQRAFVADASHELRTPLTVIRGQLEVLAAQEHPSGVSRGLCGF